MTDDLGLDSGDLDVLLLHDGTTMQTHGPARCFGDHCCIHKPSEHPLNTAPLAWNDDLKMMFRVCSHGEIHPDPDAMEFHLTMMLVGLRSFYDGWHPCCESLCCSRPSSVLPRQRSGTVTENALTNVEDDEVIDSFVCPDCKFTNFYADPAFSGFCRRCHTYSGPSLWHGHPRLRTCDECSRPNPPWWTEDAVWREVTGEQSDATLCPTCFLLRAADAGVGLKGVWQMYPPGEMNNEPKDVKPTKRRRKP